jgi:hypothetical protein
MTENDLIEFGRAWVRHLRQKTRCFELAADICGGDVSMLDEVRRRQLYLEDMRPLSVGVLVLNSWGATIPDDILRKAGCVPVTHTGTVEVH